MDKSTISKRSIFNSKLEEITRGYENWVYKATGFAVAQWKIHDLKNLLGIPSGKLT